MRECAGNKMRALASTFQSFSCFVCTATDNSRASTVLGPVVEIVLYGTAEA